MQQTEFESFVNSERCKTDRLDIFTLTSLRALLIQKDVKLINVINGLVGV